MSTDLKTIDDVRGYVEKTLDNIAYLQTPWENAEVQELLLDVVNGLNRGCAGMVIVPEPVVAHPGPNDTPAQCMADAAWKLRNNYDAGGSNVRAAIASLLDDVARALDPTVVTVYPKGGAE